MTASPAVPNSAEATPADAIAADVPCLACGYDLRGLDRTGRCPECGNAIDESLRLWREPALTAAAAGTLAAGVTLLELAALASFASLFLPIGNPFDGPQRVVMWQQLGKIAFGLFPLVAGWWGAWVLTRASASPPRLSPAWSGVRRLVRLSASAGTLCIPAAFAVNMIVGYRVRLGTATVPVLTGLVTLASALLYVYLSRVATLLNGSALGRVCLIHAALLAGSILWCWLTGLADGLPIFLPIPFVVTPVIGSGYPIALRWPWLWMTIGQTWLPSWSPPVIAVCVAAIASLFVLEALRRAFRREFKRASARERTAASSRP